MRNIILSAVVGLVLGSVIAAGASWSPVTYNWPFNTLIGGTLAVTYSMSAGEVNAPAVLSGTTALDLSMGNTQHVSFSGAGSTTFTFANPWVGEVVQVLVTQASSNGGGNTVTWPSNIEWHGGTAPTLSTSDSVTDAITFVYDENGNWYETAVKLADNT